VVRGHFFFFFLSKASTLMMSHMGVDPLFPVCGGASITMTVVRTHFTTVRLLQGCTELETVKKISVNILSVSVSISSDLFTHSQL